MDSLIAVYNHMPPAASAVLFLLIVGGYFHAWYRGWRDVFTLLKAIAWMLFVIFYTVLQWGPEWFVIDVQRMAFRFTLNTMGIIYLSSLLYRFWLTKAVDGD